MNWLQRHWDARAAMNFMFGGAGSGLMIVALPLSESSPLPILLSLILVAAGLGAVWLEIGRKLRALNVLFNPFTSWMTRESFAALILFLLGIAALVLPAVLPYAAAAALAFLYCQARILRASKGIPAWRAPQVVPLVVSTGLVEGAGLALLFATEGMLLALFTAAVLARAVAWLRYRSAVKSRPLEPAGSSLMWIGTALALALLFVAPAAAGLAALAAGWWLKLALVTRASFNQGFSLPHLPVRGTR